MQTKLITIFLFLIFNTNNTSGMSTGNWSASTKNNTHFNAPGGGTTITLANGKEYQYPNQWYFYKDNIIGTKRLWVEDKYEYDYFVINEKEGVINTFENKESWKNFIDTNELNPLYWKRSYSYDWNHLNLVKLLALFYPIISIPIILLNIYFLYNLAKLNQSWIKWIFLHQ